MKLSDLLNVLDKDLNVEVHFKETNLNYFGKLLDLCNLIQEYGYNEYNNLEIIAINSYVDYDYESYFPVIGIEVR